jgi:hypothetical protein
MKESNDYVYANTKVMSMCMQLWAYLKNYVEHMEYVVLSFQKFGFVTE